MGKLAKADGHISQVEIDHVEQFIQKMGLTTRTSHAGDSMVQEGCRRVIRIESTYKRFMSICGHTKDLKQVLLVYLIVIALAERTFSSG